jgi:hypothetical protein
MDVALSSLAPMTKVRRPISAIAMGRRLPQRLSATFHPRIEPSTNHRRKFVACRTSSIRNPKRRPAADAASRSVRPADAGRYRYAAGQLQFDGIRGGRGHPATPGALEQWRRDPNHPLKWRYVDGRPLYRVDAVRDYLARCDKTTKPPQPHNARGDGRAARP